MTTTQTVVYYDMNLEYARQLHTSLVQERNTLAKLPYSTPEKDEQTKARIKELDQKIGHFGHAFNDRIPAKSLAWLEKNLR